MQEREREREKAKKWARKENINDDRGKHITYFLREQQKV